MFKFLKKLFSTEAEKPSEFQSTEENQTDASIGLSPFVEQAAIAIFEDENGREATDDERLQIHKMSDDISKKPVTATNMDHSDDPEILEILHQDAVEHAADAIRYVVVTFVELIKEPYPYKIKKYLPDLKEKHKMVLDQLSTDIYAEAVEFAYRDMFEGASHLLEDVEESKTFFEEYTQNPLALDLQKIRDGMPERYLNDIDPEIFSLA